MRPIFALIVSSAMAVGMPPTSIASEQVPTGTRSTYFTSTESLGLSQSLTTGMTDQPLALTDRAAPSQNVIIVAGKGDRLEVPQGAGSTVSKSDAAEPIAESDEVEKAAKANKAAKAKAKAKKAAIAKAKAKKAAKAKAIAKAKAKKAAKAKQIAKAKAKAKKVVIEPAAASEDTLLLEGDGEEDAEQSSNEELLETAVESALSESTEEDNSEENAEETEEVASADSGDDGLLTEGSDEEPAENSEDAGSDGDLLAGDENEAAESETAESDATEETEATETTPVKTAVAAPAPTKAAITGKKTDVHTNLVGDDTLFPTAAQCGECHQQIYDEWSSSNHAYASISPMFHKFEQKFQELTQGTVGTFCVRCHQQAGTQLGEKREAALWERSQIAREGVTCITCHRVKETYGKVNGERRIEPGKIFEPVYGSGEKSALKEVLDNKETYTVATKEGDRGAEIHGGMIPNNQITKSEFCVSCHQVAVNLGIKLEVVWDQYRDSPARKAGVTCQDCHMGKVPGKPEGYATAPSAIVGGRVDQPGTPACRSPFHRSRLFDCSPRYLPAQQEGSGIHRQANAGVRLARRLGQARVRGQGCRRCDQGQISPKHGRSSLTVKTPGWLSMRTLRSSKSVVRSGGRSWRTVVTS